VRGGYLSGDWGDEVSVLKTEELSNPQSCLNKARANERLFVLLARDPAAPDVIGYWVRKRIALGKNKMSDPQIVEALECAKKMEEESRHHIGTAHDKATCWHCVHGSEG
jgi:hypothetical protein